MIWLAGKDSRQVGKWETSIKYLKHWRESTDNVIVHTFEGIIYTYS